MDENVDMELDNVEFYEIRPPWNTLIRVKPVDGTLIPSPAGNGNRSTAADFFDRPPALKLVEERDLNYVINVSDSEDEHSDQPGFEVGSIREDGTKASVPPAAKEEATRISRKRLLELEKKLLEQKRQAALNLLNLETQRRQRSVAVVALGTRPSPISASAPIVQARRPGVGTDASAVSVTATGAGSAASTSIPSMGLDRSRLLSELQAAERRVYEAKELLDALRKQLAECEENVRQQQALRDEVAEQIMMSEQQNALVPGGPVDSIEHQRTDDLTAMEVDGAAPITTNKASETGVLGPSSVVLPEFDAVLADESITQKDRVMESPSAVERWTPKAEAQTTYSAPALLDLQAFEAIGLRSLFERPDRVETLSGPGHGGEDGHFVPYENIYDGPAIDTQNRLWSLDPFRPWCLFESQGGICKDQACTMHHFRELALTDDAILANLVRQLARVSSPTRFADARQELQALRSRRSTVAEISQALKHIFRAAQLAVRGTSQPLLSDASPTRPFLLTTLHDLFTGKAQRMVRYFQGTRESQAALEERLAINPRDANLWAELAIEKLQGASYHTMGESGKAIVSDALHVLSRGLQECPKSETLWLYYSELYARFATHQDAQTVIENATSLLPNSVKLRLLLLRSGIEDRDSRRAHFRQLRQLLVDSTKLDDGLKSHVTVDVLMWETQLISDSDWEAATSFLWDALTTCVTDSNAGQSHPVLVEGDFAFALNSFLHLLWFSYLPSALSCEPPNQFLMQHQPFLIDFTDFGRNKMDYIKPYISKLESLVATWSELPLRRHRDSGVEAMWLHYLALNTARLFQSLGQDSGLQPFIEFVNESSHAPLIRCTGEKNRPILYAHKQRNPYDAFDSTNLANFVSVSFHSVLRPASPDADETAE